MQKIDLRSIVDDGKINPYRFRILVLIWLAMLADGYDIAVISFAAPAITAEWGLEKGAMGPVFSAGLLGMILGGAVLGAVGDWAGRRKVMIISAVMTGLGTLGTVMAYDLQSLIAWRFVTGVGIGALAPIGVVMTAEYAPHRVRATVVACMFVAIGAGGTGLAGWLSATAVPVHGWEALFWFGGALPLVFALLAILGMPESLRYLYVRDPSSPRLAAIASRLAPTRNIAPGAAFTWSGEAPSKHKAAFRDLFAGERGPITLILWAMMFCAQVTAYGLSLWLPTLLSAAQVSPADIASTMMMHSLCGMAGGAVISHFIDRHGVVALAALPLVGVPLVIFVGMLGPGSALLAPAAAFAGFSVVGTLMGGLAVSSFFYPTAIRSNGVGAAMFVSRFGSVLGPFLLGVLLTQGAAIQTIFLVCAIPLLLAALMAFILGRLERKGGGAEGFARPRPAN